MQITLKFFAGVREALGVSEERVVVPDDVTTVGQVRDFLRARDGVWAEALGGAKPLRTAFNHVMCGPETLIVDQGEVAFFPPVTGG